MHSTLTCKHCGAEVPFDESDRGWEVYCPSCARANLAPPATEASPQARGAASPGPSAESVGKATVFSAAGAASVAEEVVGEVACLCGGKVSVRVQDLTAALYCPSCGTQVDATQLLKRGRESLAEMRQRRSGQQPVATASVPASATAAAPRSAQTAAAAVPGRRSLAWRTAVAAGAAVAALLSAYSICFTLVGSGPRPEQKGPTSGGPLGQAKSAFEPETDPEITLALVEQLPHRSDPAEALIQAQVWQEALRDQGVPAGDPRQNRLEAILAALKSRLASKPSQSGATVGEFDRLLETIADALKAKDVSRARAEFERATGVLRNNGSELANRGRRFLALRMQLEQAEAVLAGLARIEGLLAQAAKALASGQVGAALEHEAQAKFFARITPGLSEANLKKLDEQARKLSAAVRLARGKRAVADARRAAELGDVATRNREARRARNVLAGLPETQVRELLAPVRRWCEEAERAGDSRKTSSPANELSREIGLRDAYEAVLEQFGNADCRRLIAACRHLREVDPTESADRRSPAPASRFTATDLLFDVLEREVLVRLSAEGSLAEGDREAGVLATGELLDQARLWEGHYRWKTLDAVLRQDANPVAARWLETALKLAEDGKLQDALRKAERAERFGTDEVAEQAREYRRQWQAELELRASAAAEDESWQRVRTIHGDEVRRLEFWQECTRFLQRFPGSPHFMEVRRWRAEAEKTFPDVIGVAVQQIGLLLKQQEWQKARDRFAVLRAVPIPERFQAAIAELNCRFEGLQAAAEHELLLLEKHEGLLEEQNVLAALDALPRVLALCPEHPKARALFSTAQRLAAIRAKALVRSALAFRETNRAAYRAKLQRAVRLDSLGPCGEKARQLLDESRDRELAAPSD